MQRKTPSPSVLFSYKEGHMIKLRSFGKKIAAVLLAAAIILAPVMTGAGSMKAEAAGRLDTSKKGLLLESTLAGNTNYLKELGVKQVTYNLPIGTLCANGDYPYTYKGKKYYFNRGIIGQYDALVPMLNKNGISVTLILLNNWAGDATLIHPLSRDYTGANYYAFNTSEQAGMDKLEAVAQFLAGRYSGQYGTVDNWIVGNEVNARLEWNYMTAGAGLTVAAQEYAKALRLFYSVMTSHNPNARVYACIDHEWASSDNAAAHYSGKQFLTAMQAYITQTGNFNYGVAVHPYNAPLYKAQSWDGGSLAPRNQNARFVTMANISVLTDFIQQKAFLQTDGQVRSVLCSELGYTSYPFGGYVSDYNIQYAAYAFGYLQAQNNQYIDGFFARECDSPQEVAIDGMASGLLTTTDYKTFTKKPAYTAYANIDNPNQRQAVINNASAIVGTDITSLIESR